MKNGFVQRGGWWVVGQILLLLMIAGLDLTGRAALKPLPLFICGLVLIAAATLGSLAGLLALGRNLTPSHIVKLHEPSIINPNAR